MAYIPYQCCTKKFEDYYVSQAGHGLPYYQGAPNQRGYGLGGFFARLFRSAMPFLVRGAKTVGKEALRTVPLIAQDVLAGKKIKTAIQNRTQHAGKTLVRKALTKASDMVGHGRYKRKRKPLKRFIPSKLRKVIARDIFDL